MNLLADLKRAGAEQKLWQEGDCIVVAVSGGPDSMALLHMLASLAQEMKLTLIAAHVNHGFRVEESAYELEVVKAFAAKLRVHCETIVLDLPAYIEETRLNSHLAAREKRYAFLHEVADRYDAASIALAHHADDQAETVLMRILRGTGLTGLSGIHSKRLEKNVELIRPMLRMIKSDILQYCAEQDIPYCTDSSNAERYYFRNMIRLDILPYLSQYNPQLSNSLQRLAEVAGAEDEWMERQTTELFNQLVTASPDECFLSCKQLIDLHIALQRRLIKLILSYLSQETTGISFETIETMRLAAAAQQSGTWRMDAGGNIRFMREYDVLRWRRVPKQNEATGQDGYSYGVPKGTRHVVIQPNGWAFQLSYLHVKDYRKPASRFEAIFDAERLSFPLTIRNRRLGDRIQILGLNGSKKVQDMFVDEKIALFERERYPLLFDADGRLLWVPGLRRSNHALTGQTTKELLLIQAFNE